MKILYLSDFMEIWSDKSAGTDRKTDESVGR